jgi:hypothetical protein
MLSYHIERVLSKANNDNTMVMVGNDNMAHVDSNILAYVDDILAVNNSKLV